MARPSFLGAGIHTALGRGIDDNVRQLQQAPRIPSTVPVQLGNTCENIPCQLLAHDAPLDPEQRLYRVVTGVIEDALTAANLSERERRATALLVGTSSADISVSEAIFQRELAADPNAF